MSKESAYEFMVNMDLQAIAATTRYVLIDLSDTTNYRHGDADFLRLGIPRPRWRRNVCCIPQNERFADRCKPVPNPGTFFRFEC